MSRQNSDSPLSLRKALRSYLVPKKKNDFFHQPLKDKDVRFLLLGEGAGKRSLRCSLITERLEQAAGSYIAISYVWGQNPRQVSIECDGKLLEITENLQNALRACRRPDWPARVWADAICINQRDDTEKVRQLQLMGQIFGEAAKVVIWLGQDEKVASKAFEMVRQISDKICAQKGVRPASLQARKTLKDIVQDIPVRLFPANDSREWTPIAWLFEQPWFERVWVIQEVSSNRNIDVVCGSLSIDWASVALVATWIEANDEYFSRTNSVFGRFRGIYNASFMFDKDRFHDKAWLRLLDEARTFSATNSRDKIFGLLGHPSIAWNSEAGVQGLTADYSKTVPEIFADVVVRHIRQSGNLDMLSQIDRCRGIDDPLDMATWIPRFDKQRWPSAFTLIDQLHLNACGESTPIWKCGSPDRLALQGVSCGQVTSISDAAPLDVCQSQPAGPVVQFWLDHVDNMQRYPTGESQEVAMAMTLSAGANTSRSGLADARFHADFSAYLLPRLRRSEAGVSSTARQKIAASLHRLQEMSAGGHAARYADAVSNVLPYRRLCATSDGHFGLGPEAMQPGDLICVLYGGSVPFAVRARGPEWLLVGEVYVHGLMSGEGVRAIQAGRLQQQMFGFV